MTRTDLVGRHKGDGKEDKLITGQQSIRPAERSKTDFLNTSDRLGSTIQTLSPLMIVINILRTKYAEEGMDVQLFYWE